VYEGYFTRMAAHWLTLQAVVAEDISVYEQLARTKRSSGYTQHILSDRECKISHYHETMDCLIRE
jgi:hypothetical protein